MFKRRITTASGTAAVVLIACVCRGGFALVEAADRSSMAVRTDAIRRDYFRVAPEDGPPLTVYHDLISDEWARQEY